MKKIFLFLLFTSRLAYAEMAADWEIVAPLNPVTTLSGNYGELRPNHFHGGIDFRTDGEENKPVYAVDAGYVSKIHISSRGYGKLIYVNHPNGYTSLYAHLNGFIPRIDSIVKAKQYEKQMFEIEIPLDPGECEVKKGEHFAFSGNTGSSGGPHLHFEIRQTADGILKNPLELNRYFKIPDTHSPRILGVKIYGLNGNGVVNNEKEKRFPVVTNAAKKRVLQGGSNITAWGEIGFSVRANDYMTGTGFIYVPRILKLYIDNKLVSDIEISDVKYADTRALNSFIDYGQYVMKREYFMKSFKEPNSPLTIFNQTEYRGVFYIDEERTYSARYEVYDDFGLKDVIPFTIQGEKMELPKDEEEYTVHLPYGESHIFDQNNFLMYFPEKALYADLDLKYEKRESSNYCSDIHEIGNDKIPLHTFCDISIKVEKDSLEDKQKYLIVKLNNNDITSGSVAGLYVNGFMVGKINTFGKYAVTTDVEKPTITPINTVHLHRNPYLKFKIFDALSGIASYNGYIDNEWVLFEYDAKTRTITYQMDKKRIKQNNSDRNFKLVVTDHCGNVAEYQKTIHW